MKTPELIAAVFDAAAVSKTEAKRVIDAMGTLIQKQLIAGGEATLPGLGKLVVAKRNARSGRNPKTSEAVTVAACRVVKFRVSAPLKAAVK